MPKPDEVRKLGEDEIEVGAGGTKKVEKSVGRSEVARKGAWAGVVSKRMSVFLPLTPDMGDEPSLPGATRTALASVEHELRNRIVDEALDADCKSPPVQQRACACCGFFCEAVRPVSPYF